MIEQTVIDYLSGVLDVPIGAQVPPGPPVSYCTVEKRGSGESDKLLAALIAVVSKAPSKWEAMSLSKQVRAAMKAFRDTETNVFSARYTTEYDSTNEKTKEYRYTAVFRVTYLED